MPFHNSLIISILTFHLSAFPPLTYHAFNKTGKLPGSFTQGADLPLLSFLPSAPPISLLTLITEFFPYSLRLGISKRALDAIWTGDTHRFPQQCLRGHPCHCPPVPNRYCRRVLLIERCEEPDSA